MNEYVKHEKNPQEVPQKQAKLKGTLLQTYFTSLLSLVLCVSMFLGTTYAWFTSEVNNTANEIYIGMLDVGLFAGDKDLADSSNKLFDSSIRWEPGYTALETVKVVNEGDLAFKYVLSFTDGALTAGSTSSLETVADSFEVWVYDHARNQGNAGAVAEPDSYVQLSAAGSGWESAGSLRELLSGKTVLSGAMTAIRGEAEAQAEYSIALHMKENADVSVMGHKISLNVKLLAYQMGKEQDSFGDRYDRMAATADQLSEALKGGGTVALAADVTLDHSQVTVPKNVSAVLDLNGHSITGICSAGESLIVNEGTLTVTGSGTLAVSFDGTVDNSKAVNAISNRGVLTVNGGQISNTGSGNQIGYAIDNYNGAELTVNGGRITAAGSSYYDAVRLFCGSTQTLVTVNGGEISSIWAQNPSANKASEVAGTVVINGGSVTTVYYENYTVVKVADGVSTTVTPYGAGKEHTQTESQDGYSVYRFVHE